MNETYRNAPVRLGRTLKDVAGKALGKHGLAFGALLTDWPSIVGSRLADQTSPLKLAFPAAQRDNATLHLRVTGPAALLVQHEEPLIIEKINAFMGWRAVARLKLVHGAPVLKTKSYTIAPVRRLSPVAEAKLHDSTAGVEDPELREALERLGRALGATGV
ncbi:MULTISPECIES: DUF721 domain-containing protein [unclassified Azospirillum]|uniref:DUF721 domain-containing protein n=1 Tax=unclassified Azospirillum TaxID=2630922 RepID=UPI000B79AAC8|nr:MULTISPECIES: DciA family protein [unclassified Azospirillum]